jgi:peptidoglycan/xylan/chitin deacetylase (PgdA/CDA1 family)
VLIYFFLFFSSGTFSQNSYPKEKGIHKEVQNPGDISIKRWKDDYTAAFSFTFDDNMLSQYTHVFPIFQQYDFRGTFFIIAGALEDYQYWLYGTWDEFIEMYNAGQEMGSHTMSHPHLQNLPIGDTLTENTLIYELYQSKKILQQKFPGSQCIDLAYPYDEYDDDVIYYTSQFYESARAISEFPVDSTLTGNDWYKIGSLVMEFDLPRDSLPDDMDEFQYFRGNGDCFRRTMFCHMIQSQLVLISLYPFHGFYLPATQSINLNRTVIYGLHHLVK